MNWTNGIDFAITVCDKNGVITHMNDKSIKTFENDGGAKLIGTNVLDCHPEPSRTQLSGMLQTEKKNVYTIEKNGKKKLIYQTPYYDNDEYKGFVELSLEIPEVMENFVRG
jgi:transcriptional regulator with PAS, ATPase and Fis domain